MPKIWVQRAANFVRRVDDGPYGIIESEEPKDMWWEEVEMQEYKPLNWEAAYKVACEPPRNAAGDYVLYEEDGV